MAKKIAKVDSFLFLILVIFVLFFGIDGNKILDKDVRFDVLERYSIAFEIIDSKFPNNGISYLRTYSRIEETEKIFSEFLLVTDNGYIERVVGRWEDDEFRIVSGGL